MSEHDEMLMREALKAAIDAGALEEVPIGACIVDADGQILAIAGNRTITANDPTAHAEILALREAAARIGNYRLTGTTIYTTIEPCAMCAGALVNARVKRLVYGAADEKYGAVETLFRICDSESLNHQMEIESDVMADECRALMQDFFKKRREGKMTEKLGLSANDPNMRDVERLFEESMAFRDSDDYQNAIKKLDEILSIIPKRPAAILGPKAHLHFKLQQFDKALECYQEAVKLSPNSELGSLGLFHTLCELDRREDALAEASRFLRIKPESEEYRLLLDEISGALETERSG